MNSNKPISYHGRKRYYPVSLDIQGRKCVVIGGGEVAERKILSLLSCQARIFVISLCLTSRLARLASQGKICHRNNSYHKNYLRGAVLVIAATNDRRVNCDVVKEAQRLAIPVNVVDEPALSTFIVPAVLKRGAIAVSVSTNATSPFLARTIKDKLAEVLGAEYDEYSRLFAAARRRIRALYPRSEERSVVYRRISASPVLALLKAGKYRHAKALVQAIINGRPHVC